ncbi:hypothetical protein [Synechococcus sp. GFB01]|uniref:hypothetical protein n=1 Tax=Synechococcus sp. GFB01 TaxID=1662190 RepID=UPI00065D9AB4|nr:hypothetical protein SYNGFB01_00685 [Synechococcus sp. GFB01]
MPPSPQRLDPVVADHVVMQNAGWDAATEVDPALIHQAPEPDRDGLFMACKGVLVRRDPGDFALRDHTARE